MIDFVGLFNAISGYLYAALILTVIDFVMGVAVALANGKFKWDKLTSYITSDILPILAWLSAVVISAIPISVLPSNMIGVMAWGIYSTVTLRILASIAGSFGAIGVLTEQMNRVGVDTKKPMG
jgi:hypothetical protein